MPNLNLIINNNTVTEFNNSELADISDKYCTLKKLIITIFKREKRLNQTNSRVKKPTCKTLLNIFS